MSLLAPLALWGLLALGVPVILHLRRRRVGRTIEVGSVKHLGSLPTAERRGVRLREPWLLLLRLAILGMLVLLLARPMLDRPRVPAGTFALVDSATPQALRDSLATTAALLVERIDDPWRRVQELDDSLPADVPLIVVASSSSDLYSGPRPTVSRVVTWLPLSIARPNRFEAPPSTRHSAPSTGEAARALAAAVAAVAEEFGPLADTAGWRSRLPYWWADSLGTAAFPTAVARAIAPARALPPSVALSAPQLTPRLEQRLRRPDPTTDLHWWVGGAARMLLLLDRWLAHRRGVAA